MPAPVFIVGAPRSGTTLLRTVLNRHPELAVCGETNYFHRIYMRRRAFGDLADPRNRARAVDAYLATKVACRLGMDMTVLRDRLMEHATTYREFFATILSTYAQLEGKTHSGEKTPWHSFYVRRLIEWFPDCSIVHLVRDPRDSVRSLVTMPWESRSVLMCARIWRRFNDAARAVARERNYLLVRYEDLACNPEEHLRLICAQAGLAYWPEMLRVPTLHPSGVHWWDIGAYEEITPQRVGTWRNHLQPWQVRVIESGSGTLMDDFGYERQRPHVSGVAAMGRAAAQAVLEVSLQKLLRMPSILSRFARFTNLHAEEKWRTWATQMYGRLRPSPNRARDFIDG